MDEWLKNLKAGDKVIVSCGGYGFNMKLHTIDRITPTGQMIISGYRYKNGERVGSYGRWDRRPYLTEATQKNIDKIIKNDTINGTRFMYNELKLDKLSIEQLNKIKEILTIDKGEN